MFYGNNVKTFRRSYRAFPAGPTSGPDPLRTPYPDLIWTRYGPDFDPIRTRKGGLQVRIGPKSGQNRVRSRFGARGSEGVGSRGVGPAGKALQLLRKVLTLMFSLRSCRSSSVIFFFDFSQGNLENLVGNLAGILRVFF